MISKRRAFFVAFTVGSMTMTACTSTAGRTKPAASAPSQSSSCAREKQALTVLTELTSAPSQYDSAAAAAANSAEATLNSVAKAVPALASLSRRMVADLNNLQSLAQSTLQSGGAVQSSAASAVDDYFSASRAFAAEVSSNCR